MLTKKETRQLSSLLKKIDNPHQGLPQTIFEALVKIVPLVACELVIVSKKGILMTWRKDKWWTGWHFPGGLLRYQESFNERIQKVAWDELGVQISSYKFLHEKNYTHSQRGHEVSLIFLCKTKMEPKNGKFFKRMPKNIIESHKELWAKVKKYIKS